jgi:putative acetyltransferase
MSQLALRIRREGPHDKAAIEQVNRLAFGGDDEARLVNALREEGHLRLSLVAELDDEVIGHILFSHLPIICGPATKAALALAPMAVSPKCQRQGIGSQLIRRGLETCRSEGHQIVVVLGHPEFYRRFGFSHGLTRQLLSPYSGSESFMARELVEGALEGVAGTVRYPPPFDGL